MEEKKQTMTTYKDLIMAKKAEQVAVENLKKLEKEHAEEECRKAFKDFLDAWNEVKDTQVRNHRYGNYQAFMVPLSDQLARMTDHSLEFYNGYGNTGHEFWCEWDEESQTVIYKHMNHYDNATLHTKAQLLDMFLSFLATRMP